MQWAATKLVNRGFIGWGRVGFWIGDAGRGLSLSMRGRVGISGAGCSTEVFWRECTRVNDWNFQGGWLRGCVYSGRSCGGAFPWLSRRSWWYSLSRMHGGSVLLNRKFDAGSALHYRGSDAGSVLLYREVDAGSMLLFRCVDAGSALLYHCGWILWSLNWVVGGRVQDHVGVTTEEVSYLVGRPSFPLKGPCSLF